jgi:hypothetical protein
MAVAAQGAAWAVAPEAEAQAEVEVEVEVEGEAACWLRAPACWVPGPARVAARVLGRRLVPVQQAPLVSVAAAVPER